ncbi:nucleoside hydrolase [Falsiroseomonas sp. HW251]|uniref:nucleoside hydrolase n=1 Tax=Falsiroseomonas sp. HW251 TaxID=3390998 RepID=UPI003D32035C
MSLPPSKMVRVILNTDAKNEADDQYAIVQALLTPMFDLHCIMPAHFGRKKSAHSLKDSHDEVQLLLDLMDLKGKVRVIDGAEDTMPDERTPADSAGARFIIEQVMKDDPRPLHVAFLGPLTDMAAAILMEPRIVSRNVRVVWIGGGVWPVGGQEYNLSNDIAAANVVFRSGIEIWQIPKPLYRVMAVSYAELRERVEPHGRIGKYLVEQLIEHNAHRPEPLEHRSLGDSPAIGVMMYPECGQSDWRAAPEFNALMNYEHTGRNRTVKVYTDIDQRYIHEDFFAKLARFNRGVQELAKFDG